MHTSSLSDNQSVEGATPRGPYGAGASSVQVAALPDTSNDRPSYASPPAQQPPYQAKAFSRTPREPNYGREAAAPHAPPLAKGEMIQVQPGDTLYGLSRRHHVSLTD